MKSPYLLDTLINLPFKTLGELSNIFVEYNVQLESMKVISSVDNTAWMEVFCRMDVEKSKSIMQCLALIEGVIESELVERCSSFPLIESTGITCLKEAV